MRGPCRGEVPSPGLTDSPLPQTVPDRLLEDEDAQRGEHDAAADGPRHRAHMALARSRRPKWEITWKELDVPGRGKMKVQIGDLSELQWWFGTLAMFQRGGEDWIAWFAAARSALLGHQRKDGCARGSWDPEGEYERAVGGRVMSTALGVLILEEPVRHRPR